MNVLQNRYMHIKNRVKLYPLLKNTQMAIVPRRSIAKKDRAEHIFSVTYGFVLLYNIFSTNSPPSSVLMGRELMIAKITLLEKNNSVYEFFGRKVHRSARIKLTDIPEAHIKISFLYDVISPLVLMSIPKGNRVIFSIFLPHNFIVIKCPHS